MDLKSFNSSELKIFQIPMFEMFENLFSISYGILNICIRKENLERYFYLEHFELHSDSNQNENISNGNFFKQTIHHRRRFSLYPFNQFSKENFLFGHHKFMAILCLITFNLRVVKWFGESS